MGESEPIQEQEEPRIKYFPVHAIGDTLEEAEDDLTKKVEEYKTELNLDLSGEPKKEYSIEIFKGQKSRASLRGYGRTYQEALDTCVEEFSVNLDDFNQEVKIVAMYSLSKEEAEKVEEQTTSAGPMPRRKQLDDYVF